ncbi:hypothetical protein [Marinobacterium sediminicola]|uniref:Uncharacterized protein n=1 Tax=Marinobacterium sediminicola TaxID=518898 RepID=A0ABY1RWE9_9GAMM|nr:hypothetical protein [Marinobacterium sediminicola]ULG70327.1 hypothetical protein LN244_05805 [Marinobacterium sediminicola]SMR69717.1 hypothetical protein SAMN04487964_101339 [Marinobacterium sediminicola]
MSLNWELSEGKHPFVVGRKGAEACRFHCAESVAVEDNAVKDDLEETLAQAITFLNANVKNESLFFMVEWDAASSTLTLSVTDAQKEQDAADVVTCRFAELQQQLEAEGEAALDVVSSKIAFWAKDFLSTCTPFMNYSLVAVYTDGDRDKAGLL